MATPKICGIETEYGISVTGQGEFNPVVSSSLLINSYADSESTRIRWDFDDESPGRDARGACHEGALAPEIETQLVNVVLTNGARYYVDHAHPEYSSPEVSSPRDALLYDKAGERVLAASVVAAQRVLPPGQTIRIYKNNSDGKGNSYGCHENYLVAREVPFNQIVKTMLAFFTTRQVICGAGKIGSEHGQRATDYQVSQRADFFEEEVGLETTLKRPIVNTRDEPHADPAKYRRLHVICGDANMAEVATFLKIGTTSLVLSMLEDVGFDDVLLLNPVGAMHDISRDTTCRRLIQLSDGTTATAVEVQWEYLDKVKKYVDERDAEFEPIDAEVLERWESVLCALEVDPRSLDGVLDWPTKLGILEAYRERAGIGWDSAKLALIDLQYHDVRPDEGLANRLMRSGRLETMLDEAEIAEAIVEPPATTRAYFRGKCLERFPQSVVAANWDSLVFDLGGDHLQRVPMLEPTRGTKALVGDLLSRSETPRELLDGLGSN